jgi:cell division protein FtsB
MVSILETSNSATVKTPPSTPPAQHGAAGKTALTVLSVVIALLVIGGGVLAWFVYGQAQEQKAMSAQVSPLSDVNKKIANLETRANVGEEQAAKFKAQAEVYAERLGLTQKELDRMATLAKKYREEWTAQIGALTGEMGQVKQKLDEHGKAIEETRGALQRAIGDLGEQSGLIARNYEEVQDLKRKGERDYFDFNIKKQKEFDRVGPIALRLRNADQKKSRYTITLLADDREIEKKDKTLLEPVQFYMKGKRTVNELVVYEITKDRIIGYLSATREAPAAAAAAAAH